jgi:hypothetical protein
MNDRAKYLRIICLIDEYIGKHFRFLHQYIEGGYEDFVKQNIDKITSHSVFGTIRKRKEYQGKSEQGLIDAVLLDCEKTVKYIKRNLF